MDRATRDTPIGLWEAVFEATSVAFLTFTGDDARSGLALRYNVLFQKFYTKENWKHHVLLRTYC